MASPGTSAGSSRGPGTSTGSSRGPGTSAGPSRGPNEPDPNQDRLGITRKFLPHQMPIKVEAAEHQNILTFMETVEGPQAVLRKAINEKLKVKVWTRSDTGIRGYLTGFVVAFDRHWNLALRCVDEHFQRKRLVKCPPEGEDSKKPEVTKTTSDTGTKDSTKSDVSKATPYCEAGQSSTQTEIVQLQNRLKQIVMGNRLSYQKRYGYPSNLFTHLHYLSKRNYILIENEDAHLIYRLHDDIRTSRLSRPSTLIEDPGCSIVPRQLERGRDTMRSKNRSSSSSQTQKKLTRSQLNKKRLRLLDKPFTDHNGLTVVAVSEMYEFVERYVNQLFVMGNDVVFIEILRRPQSSFSATSSQNRSSSRDSRNNSRDSRNNSRSSSAYSSRR